MASLTHPDWLLEAALGADNTLDIVNSSNMTIATGYSDPDGGTNAIAVRETTATGYHAVRLTIAGDWKTGDEGHLHFFVRQRGTDKDLQIGFYDTTGGPLGYARFDFSAGTFSTLSGCDGEAQSAGGSPLWYEIDLRTTSADMGGTVNGLTYVYLHHNLAATYAGTVTDGFDLYQFAADHIVDISENLEDAIIRQGRSSEWDRSLASTMDVTLWDGDEDFNPENTASPYYLGLYPLNPVRLTAFHDYAPPPVPTTLSGSWGGQYVTPAYGAARPPGFSDTYSTAIRETTSTGYHYVRFAVPIALGSSGEGDVFHWRCAIKQQGADKDVRMYFDATTNYFATFDISAAAFSAASSGINTRVDSLGSGWYMLEIWNDPDLDISGLTYVNIYLNAAASYAGTVTDGIDLYIPQGKDEGYSVWGEKRLFQGYIQKITAGGWLSDEENYRTTLQCVDRFTKMQLEKPSYSASASTSNPLGYVFGTGLGWPSFAYDVPTLSYTCSVPAETGDRSILDILAEAMGELGGMLYIRHRDGAVVWEDYTDVFVSETAPRDAYQTAIDDSAASVKIIRDAGTIYNRLVSTGGTNNKPLSQMRYGIRELTIGTANWYDPYGGDGLYNQYTHSQYGRSRAKVRLDGGSVDLTHAQINRALWDRVRIREATGVNADYAIELIEHTVKPRTPLDTRWELMRFAPW